jgi:hypothetical protein
VHIYKSGLNPTAIIGRGMTAASAHVASMVSRILCLPSGTHFAGSELSFVNDKTEQLGEL